MGLHYRPTPSGGSRPASAQVLMRVRHYFHEIIYYKPILGCSRRSVYTRSIEQIATYRAYYAPALNFVGG